MKSTSEDKPQAQPEVNRADPEKLTHKDREILRHLDPLTGQSDVRDPQPGYRYARITCADGHDAGAQQNIRQMHADAERFGYELVSGEDPEDAHLKGETSARRLGDTHLFRISEANYQRMQEYMRRKGLRHQAVEEEIVFIGNQKLQSSGASSSSMHGGAGDLSRDPLMLRRFGGAARPERIMVANATEGDIRRGSLRDVNGNPVPPGFDTQAGTHVR